MNISVMNSKDNWNIFSKNRNAIYGVAIISIMIFHFFEDIVLMHLNIACVRGIFCVNNKENYVKKIEHTKKIINTPVFKDAIKKFHIKNNFSVRTLPVFFMKYKLVHIASIIYIVRAYQNYIYEKSRN